MDNSMYYLSEHDGSVCRKNFDGDDVVLDEYEVVAELSSQRCALTLIATTPCSGLYTGRCGACAPCVAYAALHADHSRPHHVPNEKGQS